MSRPSSDSLCGHPACADCPQRADHGSGCQVVSEGDDVPLDAFLEREPCALKEHLRAFARRHLAQRPRSLLEPEDLVQDVLGQLLADGTRRAGAVATSLPGFLAYLRRAAVHRAIDAERRERGRVRCGNCEAYGAWWGVCLAPDHAWTHRPLSAGDDPRRLEPPCDRFRSRRQSVGLDPELAAALPARPPSDPERGREQALHQALVALAEADPRAALVVRAHLLEDRPYDELAGPGLSVRTLKRLQARGLAWLRQRLDEGARSSEASP